MRDSIDVLVLSGGPDREREVSLLSGSNVAQSLQDAGHRVTQSDLLPNDTAGLQRWLTLTEPSADRRVVWPALHGKWGEGGGAQSLLEQACVPFVGCHTHAAALCFDKQRTKDAAQQLGIPIIPGQLLDTTHTTAAQARQAAGLPAVIKPNDEGSSIDLALCHHPQDFDDAWQRIAPRHRQLLVERLITGKELTVGVLHVHDQPQVLPPIWIRPATDFYDYEAKYNRDDTRYDFDLQEPAHVLQQLNAFAKQLFRGLHIRHLCRADFIVDADHRCWLLEVNTMPGFTGHSLVPMAAKHAGYTNTTLCDAIVRAACLPVSRDDVSIA